jgi:hypothetical protein
MFHQLRSKYNKYCKLTQTKAFRFRNGITIESKTNTTTDSKERVIQIIYSKLGVRLNLLKMSQYGIEIPTITTEVSNQELEDYISVPGLLYHTQATGQLAVRGVADQVTLLDKNIMPDTSLIGNPFPIEVVDEAHIVYQDPRPGEIVYAPEDGRLFCWNPTTKLWKELSQTIIV